MIIYVLYIYVLFFTFSMGFTQNHGLVASVRDSHGFSLWDHGWPRMTMYFPTIQGARAANSSRCWSHKNPKRSTRRTRRLSEMHWQNCKTSFPQKNVFHHWELPWYLLNMSQICLNNVEKDVEGLNLLEVTKQRLLVNLIFRPATWSSLSYKPFSTLINSVDSCGGLPQKKTSQATSMGPHL